MTQKPDTLRASHLDAILDDYCSQSSPTENLIDLLADAMHWCLLNDESFAALLTTAQMHIEIEAGVYSGKPPPPPVYRPEPNARFPIGPRPLGSRLMALSDQTGQFARNHNVWLSFEDYLLLMEQKAELRAFTNLIGSPRQVTFLAGQIRKAEEYLVWMQARANMQAN